MCASLPPCPRSRTPPHTFTASRFCPHLVNRSLPQELSLAQQARVTTTFSLFLLPRPGHLHQSSSGHEFWCGGTTTLHPHGCRAGGALAEFDPETEGILGGAVGGDGDLEPGHGAGMCVCGGWCGGGVGGEWLAIWKEGDVEMQIECIRECLSMHKSCPCFYV